MNTQKTHTVVNVIRLVYCRITRKRSLTFLAKALRQRETSKRQWPSKPRFHQKTIKNANILQNSRDVKLELE